MIADATKVQAAAPAKASAAEQRLLGVARDFEAVFTQMLMSSMRSTVKKSDMFDGGRGEQVFQGLLDEEIAKRASSRGRGLGIADAVVNRYAKYVKAEDAATGTRIDLRAGGNP